MSYALITGASGGLGKEIAIQFAKRKMNLVLLARRENVLEEIKKEIQKDYDIDVICLKCDLSLNKEIKNAIAMVKNHKITYLINNAGVASYEAMWDADLEFDQKMINLNINALTFLTQHFLSKFVKQDEGTILNISSVAGAVIVPGVSVYSATKWYVSEMTKQTSLELNEIKSKVQIKCLEPGAIDTGFFSVSNSLLNKEKLKESLLKVFSPDLVVSPKDCAKFAMDLIDSEHCMGRIIGANKRTWNIEASDSNSRTDMVKAIVGTYEK